MTSSSYSSYIAVPHKKIEAADRTPDKIIYRKVSRGRGEKRKDEMKKGSLLSGKSHKQVWVFTFSSQHVCLRPIPLKDFVQTLCPWADFSISFCFSLNLLQARDFFSLCETKSAFSYADRESSVCSMKLLQKGVGEKWAAMVLQWWCSNHKGTALWLADLGVLENKCSSSAISYLISDE